MRKNDKKTTIKLQEKNPTKNHQKNQQKLFTLTYALIATDALRILSNL